MALLGPIKRAHGTMQALFHSIPQKSIPRPTHIMWWKLHEMAWRGSLDIMTVAILSERIKLLQRGGRVESQ